MTSLLASLVLQVTDLSCYEDGGMYSCMVSDINAAFGGSEIAGLFIGAGLMIAFYIAGDFDPTVPPMATILFGAMLIPALPPAYTTVGTTMVLFGIIIGVFVAAQRYVLQVGT